MNRGSNLVESSKNRGFQPPKALIIFPAAEIGDYPTYRAKGWAIGSGPIESACKTVIGKRMKNGGMRWSEDGGDEMCHLRALFASDENQWDAYWHPQPN